MEWSVNVWVRVKPLSTSESEDERNHWWKAIENTITVNGEKYKDSFTFDNVFSDDK